MPPWEDIGWKTVPTRRERRKQGPQQGSTNKRNNALLSTYWSPPRSSTGNGWGSPQEGSTAKQPLAGNGQAAAWVCAHCSTAYRQKDKHIAACMVSSCKGINPLLFNRGATGAETGEGGSPVGTVASRATARASAPSVRRPAIRGDPDELLQSNVLAYFQAMINKYPEAAQKGPLADIAKNIASTPTPTPPLVATRKGSQVTDARVHVAERARDEAWKACDMLRGQISTRTGQLEEHNKIIAQQKLGLAQAKKG